MADRQDGQLQEPASLWRRFRRWPRWGQGVVWATAGLFAVGSLVPSGGESGDAVTRDRPTTSVAAIPTTRTTTADASTTTTAADASVTTTAAPTTTALPAATAGLPAGVVDTMVTAHVDGDTLKVATGETIRLIGVDTPETKHPSQPVECYGFQASEYTAERFPVGTRVRLVHDVERTDRYGRTLAYVHRADDGLFLNLTLVRDGFGQVSTYPPNVAHVEELVAAQREAREANRGLWGAECGTPAPAPGPPQAVGGRTTPYTNCTEARQAGAAPVLRGDPGYGTHLDGDSDGIGCE